MYWGLVLSKLRALTMTNEHDHGHNQITLEIVKST